MRGKEPGTRRVGDRGDARRLWGSQVDALHGQSQEGKRRHCASEELKDIQKFWFLKSGAWGGGRGWAVEDPESCKD